MKVLFSGSFNPFHNGHEYVYNSACNIFGKENVFIGITVNSDKKNSDVVHLKRSIIPITRNIVTYENISTGHFMQQNGFSIALRGINFNRDNSNEKLLAHHLKEEHNIETVYINTPDYYDNLSSSYIRELLKYKYDTTKYLNQDVLCRWLHDDNSKTFNDMIIKVYYGKSCVGKTSYLKDRKISYTNMDDFFWECIRNDKEGSGLLSSQKLNEYKGKLYSFMDNYQVHAFRDFIIQNIVPKIMWEKMFYSRADIDFAALGFYWEFIPLNIKAKLHIVKLTNSEENRNKYIKTKVFEKNIEFLDSLYIEPPYYDEEIDLSKI